MKHYLFTDTLQVHSFRILTYTTKKPTNPPSRTRKKKKTQWKSRIQTKRLNFTVKTKYWIKQYKVSDSLFGIFVTNFPLCTVSNDSVIYYSVAERERKNPKTPPFFLYSTVTQVLKADIPLLKLYIDTLLSMWCINTFGLQILVSISTDRLDIFI